jgi:hypothetical protein
LALTAIHPAIISLPLAKRQGNLVAIMVAGRRVWGRRVMYVEVDGTGVPMVAEELAGRVG